jgi:SHS2 domain-containing protein
MAARGRFRFLDGIAPADAAFEAVGNDVNACFEAAARAMFSIIVNIAKIEPQSTRVVQVKGDSIEELLFNWLSELVYLKDVHRELYGDFAVRVWQDSRWNLEAGVVGDAVDSLRSETRTDVKAVTYHKLAVERSEQGVKATVVVDL